MTATDAIGRRRQSEHEARERLAAKRVERTYRGPRGNQEVDQAAMKHSLAKLERLVR